MQTHFGQTNIGFYRRRMKFMVLTKCYAMFGLQQWRPEEIFFGNWKMQRLRKKAIRMMRLPDMQYVCMASVFKALEKCNDSSEG